jgi:glucose/arabinose dehydrogenase
LAVTPVVTGLSQPWDIAFTPDGHMLFTQKPGPIDVLIGGTVRELARPTDAVVASEGGMMGLAVDSQFATNRFIYTCFLSDHAGVRDVRVVRWTVDAGYTTLTNRADIITGIPYSTGRHSGCRPRFGPDGFLWVGTGDSAQGTVPQDKHSLGGKILRVDRNGNGAPGNPGGAFLPQIYNYGHRNVQGLAFRPADGKAFSVEHGTDRDDEVNLLLPGVNYGWDPVPGYDESTPMTDTTKFPDAKKASWSSGFPTIAPSGATFVTGNQWGALAGSLAIAVLKGSQLRFMSFDPNGDLAVDWGPQITNQGRLRTAVQGPDGNLYIAQDASPGSILRVVPSFSG